MHQILMRRVTGVGGVWRNVRWRLFVHCCVFFGFIFLIYEQLFYIQGKVRHISSVHVTKTNER